MTNTSQFGQTNYFSNYAIRLTICKIQHLSDLTHLSLSFLSLLDILIHFNLFSSFVWLNDSTRNANLHYRFLCNRKGNSNLIIFNILCDGSGLCSNISIIPGKAREKCLSYDMSEACSLRFSSAFRQAPMTPPRVISWPSRGGKALGRRGRHWRNGSVAKSAAHYRDVSHFHCICARLAMATRNLTKQEVTVGPGRVQWK